MDTIKNLFNKEKQQFLEDYKTFLRFQSISTDPSYSLEIKACSDWLVNYLKEMGFEVEVWSTSGYPTIFASYLKAGPDKPTLLIYNHYDVQPVDPLELWESPPFEPTERNGQIYARGAQDNKGQCIYTLQAMKLLIQRDGTLPINVKFVIEGEEESGSTGISELVKIKQKELKADYLAIVDMGISSMDRPAVTLGVRGLITMDVEAYGSTGDLHSGSHGGVVFNPIHALIEIFASLRDSEGKITIPGFYDDVAFLTEEEKKQLSLDFNEEEYQEMFGTCPTGGEKGYLPNERAWLRPTLEINGISGGYSGKGFKTVIPARASAKVSCRLVANQDPNKIMKLVKEAIIEKAPSGIRIEVHAHPGMGKAVRAPANSNIVKAFSKSYEEIFGKPCENILGGGTIPIVSELALASGSEVVLLGLALPDDQIHAPNEHFGIDRLEKGCYIVARALEILEKIKTEKF